MTVNSFADLNDTCPNLQRHSHQQDVDVTQGYVYVGL